MAGVTVTGTGAVLESLKRRSLGGKRTGEVIVGYNAPYAVYVHEDLTKKHSVGQAKFLEQASRVNQMQINQIIATQLRYKKSFKIALQKAGEFLLQESKKLVPVDTGFLRDSGFVRVV